MQRDTKITLLVLLVVIVLGVCLIAWLRLQATPTPPLGQSATSTQQAFSHQYTTADNTPVQLTADTESVQVVSAWASWCPDCVEQLRTLVTVAERMHDEPVVIRAMNRAEPVQLAESFLDQEVPVVRGSAVQVLYDSGDVFFTGVVGRTMPETVIFAPDGSVLWQTKRKVDATTLEAAISDAISLVTAQ